MYKTQLISEGKNLSLLSDIVQELSYELANESALIRKQMEHAYSYAVNDRSILSSRIDSMLNNLTDLSDKVSFLEPDVYSVKVQLNDTQDLTKRLGNLENSLQLQRKYFASVENKLMAETLNRSVLAEKVQDLSEEISNETNRIDEQANYIVADTRHRNILQANVINITKRQDYLETAMSKQRNVVFSVQNQLLSEMKNRSLLADIVQELFDEIVNETLLIGRETEHSVNEINDWSNLSYNIGNTNKHLMSLFGNISSLEQEMTSVKLQLDDVRSNLTRKYFIFIFFV